MNLIDFIPKKKTKKTLDHYELSERKHVMHINKFIRKINKKIENKTTKEENITASMYMKNKYTTIERYKSTRKI